MLTTVSAALDWGRAALRGKSSAPGRDAAVLLSRVLGVPTEVLFTHPEMPLDEDKSRSYQSLILRRSAGEPLAYITGDREFMGLSFQVDPRVLIPRPETELVVETVLQELRGEEDTLIGDICCGSGVIGLSLLHYLPSARAYFTDISCGALEVARENARRLGTSDRATFLHGNLCKPLIDIGLGRSLHVVASNPPYICSSEIASLPTEVRDYEPAVALDGGPDGLAVIRELIAQASLVLCPGGLLVFEIGYDQGEECRGILAQHGGWTHITVRKDLAGFDRVVAARLKR